MPKSTTARYGSEVISVEKAIEMREGPASAWGPVTFSCVVCERPVRPHKAGGGAAAHFEHLAQNPQCALSRRGTA